MVHAKMFEAVRLVYGAEDREIADPIHWFMNMSGRNYGRELLFYINATASLGNGLLKAAVV